MGITVKKEDRKYCYGDYLSWSEEERWELIGGVAYAMSPAPPRRHQEILGELHRQISNFLLGKNCRVYIAPFDVRLPEGNERDEEIRTVVQPDLVVVCDQSKLDEKGCRGAPDLVIEVVLPATVKKDMREKFFLYERVGVQEYWIVHPVDKTILVFVLGEDKKYGRPEVYAEEGNIKVGVLPDLTIDLQAVFRE